MHKRDIDALIATEILKWKKVKVDTIDNDYYFEWHDEEGEFKDFYDDFTPTTCMACAWLVAEEFDNIEIEKEYDKYYVAIYTGETDPECEHGSQLVHFVRAETAQMGICLAALELVGIEITL